MDQNNHRAYLISKLKKMPRVNIQYLQFIDQLLYLGDFREAITFLTMAIKQPLGEEEFVLVLEKLVISYLNLKEKPKLESLFSLYGRYFETYPRLKLVKVDSISLFDIKKGVEGYLNYFETLSDVQYRNIKEKEEHIERFLVHPNMMLGKLFLQLGLMHQAHKYLQDALLFTSSSVSKMEIENLLKDKNDNILEVDNQNTDTRKPWIVHVIYSEFFGGPTKVLFPLLEALKSIYEFQIMSYEELDSVLNMIRLPDLVVFHNTPTVDNMAIFIKTSMMTKTILNEHNLEDNFSSTNPQYYNMAIESAEASFKYATKVVAVSEHQKQWLIDQKLVSKNKITCITQCPPLIDLLQLPFKPRGQKIVFGCFGRIVKQKGFDIMIQAFIDLQNDNFELRIAGDGTELDYLKKLSFGHNNIHFIGFVGDISHFLLDIDIVVIPSIWEAWGNVCIEAKAAGKIIIASDVGGLTEQLGNTGFLVPANNHKALTNVINEVLKRNDWLSISQKNRELVQYSWDQYISLWKEEFDSTLQR